MIHTDDLYKNQVNLSCFSPVSVHLKILDVNRQISQQKRCVPWSECLLFAKTA